MRLRVATLNVWAIPLVSRHVAVRMRAIGERLGALDLDVAAFQEAWTSGTRETLIAAGRRAGLTHVWHRERSLVGSGLLVLSRLPIEDVDFDRFALRGGRLRRDELLGGKGYVELRLRTPAGPVALFATHLHAGTAREGSSTYHAQRTAQVVQLARAVRALREPVIVLGDLNFLESDPEHRVLCGLTGLRDLAAERGRREPTALRANPYRRGSSKPDRRIDYVLARDGETQGLRLRHIARTFDTPLVIDGEPAAYSDHAGIAARLEVAPSATAGRHPADPKALALAARLLEDGTETAHTLRERGRTWAGAGIAGAALAATGRRKLPANRRIFLRTALQMGALVALTPGIGLSLSSEWLVPEELRGFREARADLAHIRAEARASVPA